MKKEKENIKKEEAASEEVTETKDTEKELKEMKKALEEAEKKAKETEEKLAEATDRMMRIAAEYDNFRKRAVKEKEDAYTDSYIDVVKELLPVMDNLERAKSFAKEDGAGTALIMKQLSEVFEKLGVKEIPAENLPFDPNFHNAVMIDEGSDAEENTVTAVLQKGYTVRDKVIRFSMVKVAK